MRARELAVHTMELFHVDLAIVRRQTDADQQYHGAAFLALFDDIGEITAHVGECKAAQAVVATQLYYKNTRVMLCKRLPSARETAACSVAADAGIDDVVTIA